MENIGATLVIIGLIAALITGTRQLRYAQDLWKYVEANHNELWLKLGKPGFSFSFQRRAGAIPRLIEKDIEEFSALPEILKRQKLARKWLYMAMANMFVVFVGVALMMVNS